MANMNIDAKGFGKRLATACDYSGLPPYNKGRGERLAEMAGVTTMTVSYWLDGTFMPSKRKRELICEKLNVSEIYLNFGIGEIGDTSLNRKLKLVKFKFVPKFGFNKKYDFSKFSDVSVELEMLYENAFATMIYDDAMYPIYPKDTLAVVDMDSTIINRSIVAIHKSDTNEILFRQYFNDQDKVFLSPINNKFNTYEISEHITIIGLVVFVQISPFV